jgi:hypothetical protein
LLSQTYLSTFYINFLITILSKIAPKQRLVSSLTILKKLIRLQRTTQSFIKPASKDVYNIALNNNSSKAINKDDSFYLYIACKTKEILNTTSNNSSVKDTKSQVRFCVYLVFDTQLIT